MRRAEGKDFQMSANSHNLGSLELSTYSTEHKCTSACGKLSTISIIDQPEANKRNGTQTIPELSVITQKRTT